MIEDESELPQSLHLLAEAKQDNSLGKLSLRLVWGRGHGLYLSFGESRRVEGGEVYIERGGVRWPDLADK